jgi:thiol-disulfide isomerase/thioredoxin
MASAMSRRLLARRGAARAANRSDTYAGPAAGRYGLLLATVAAGLLAGCAQDSGAGVIDQGYVSGDGSVTQWALQDRADPVVVAGVDFAGNAVSTQDWPGDVIVLNTWYAACGPCRAEAPDLVALATDRAGDGVRVLGINTQDAAGAARAFESRFAVPYPSIEDSSATAIADLSQYVAIKAVPTTVVLDKDHRPAARILGQADPSTLGAIIDDILAEP